jgi:hypothetical protein
MGIWAVAMVVEAKVMAVEVTSTAVAVETILETTFGGDFHVAKHVAAAGKTNANVYTVAFGDGHPGDIEMMHVGSGSMTTGTVYVTELAPGALRHTESNVIEGRAYRFKLAAKNIAGRSAPSAARTVLAANLPFATPKPLITDVSGSKIALVWDAPNSNFVHEIDYPIFSNTESVLSLFFIISLVIDIFNKK